MATPIEFIKYVIDQITGYSNIRFRKMFGEYMVYVNDKPILLVCDSTVYVKKREELETILSEAELGIPYDGAKEHYILDLDNRELTQQVISILEEITPVPKKRKKNWNK